MTTTTQSGHIIQIYKSRKTIIAHLKNQGYDVSSYDGFSINDVHILSQTKQLDMLFVASDQKKAYVKYHLAKTLRLDNIQNEYIEDLFNLEEVLTKKDDLIIIMKDEPNESLVKSLKNIWEQDGIFVNVFNIQRLQYNVMEHALVPPHEVLSKEAALLVKKKYNITDDSQIPDISRFSPVAQAIGMRPGDLCKITRPSKTAINTEFYRICSA
jgi:DNA-directed RNA polymerase subunit H (RpoH/RPB5)